MKIYTSYFAMINKLPDTLLPVSICGKSPDWYHGLEYKQLAPKYSFFKIWKDNHDNDYYIDHYKKEVLAELSINQVFGELDIIRKSVNSSNKDIVLLCYEKSSDFCHRHLVRDWISYYGYECEELVIK